MSYYTPFATTQPSWIEAMMAHVQADCVCKFSTSGGSDDTSVFWEPDLLSFTDPFTTHSPTDSTIPLPSLENFSTLPSSPSPTATVSTDEEKRSHTSHTCHRGAPLEQSPILKLSKLSNDNTVDAGQSDEQKRKENIQAEAGCVGGGIIRARAIRTTSGRQTHKRTIEDIDTEPDTDQEDFDVSSNHAPVETQKRICREKTGTDWQTVLDIMSCGKQWSRQS
ncbi:hypothetical protein EV702DRAFT_1199857 [Suillus placidus]|uniref:Uncharacterized protein n=1 Tax=Suillus placidus TaxID=48579 RepID=A0A9P7D0V2_9AGAM|nr:hypothetical protein EV702DRAFT_1199857 [Suillus placidus]